MAARCEGFTWQFIALFFCEWTHFTIKDDRRLKYQLDLVRSFQIFLDHVRSCQITLDHVRSSSYLIKVDPVSWFGKSCKYNQIYVNMGSVFLGTQTNHKSTQSRFFPSNISYVPFGVWIFSGKSPNEKCPKGKIHYTWGNFPLQCLTTHELHQTWS